MPTFSLATATPMGEAYVTIIERARAEIGAYLDDPSYTAPAPIRQASATWRAATATLDRIPPVLSSLAERVQRIAADRDLTDQAVAERITAAAAEAQKRVAQLADEVRDRLTRMVDTLRRAVVPARPGETAADEARIAGVKTDLRMVLDAAPATPTVLADRIAELLERAMRDGDQHTVYVLAATHWPADYVAARDPAGAEGAEQLIAARVDQVLDRYADGEVAEVRRVYRAVTSASGVNAITVALAQLPSLIGGVSKWARNRAAARW